MRQCRGQIIQLGADGPKLEIWPRADSGFILFYPGSMLGPGHYFVLLEALWSAGFSVAALHLNGHGLNCPPFWALDRFSFESLMENGLAAEAWLRKKFGLPLAVLGHSQGGIQALAHAGESSGIKASFAICAVAPQLPEAIELTRFAPLQAHREKLIKFFTNCGQLLPWLPLPLPFYLELHKLVAGKAKPIIIGKEHGRWSYPLAYLASLFSAKVKTELKCPFYLYGAENDALFTKKIMRATYQSLDAPLKELVWLANGGHTVPFNPFWARFIARSMAERCVSTGFSLSITY